MCRYSAALLGAIDNTLDASPLVARGRLEPVHTFTTLPISAQECVNISARRKRSRPDSAVTQYYSNND